MPIVVGHEPVAQIQQLATIGGLGQYASRQQAVALQLAGMQQQREMQMRQIAATQQAQAASQQFQAYQQGSQLGAQQSRDLMQRGWETQDRDQQQALQWATQSAPGVEQGINATMARLAGKRADMTPEGQRLMGDLSGKLRALQRAKASVNPVEYGRLLNQFGTELQGSGLENHIQEPPTIADELKRRSYTDPTTGMGYILQPDGELRPVPPVKADKQPVTIGPVTPQAIQSETILIPGEGRYGRNKEGQWDLIAPHKEDLSETKSATAREKAQETFVQSFVGKEREVVKNAGTENETKTKVPYTPEEIAQLWADRQSALSSIRGDAKSTDSVSVTPGVDPLDPEDARPVPLKSFESVVDRLQEIDEELGNGRKRKDAEAFARHILPLVKQARDAGAPDPVATALEHWEYTQRQTIEQLNPGALPQMQQPQAQPPANSPAPPPPGLEPPSPEQGGRRLTPVGQGQTALKLVEPQTVGEAYALLAPLVPGSTPANAPGITEEWMRKQLTDHPAFKAAAARAGIVLPVMHGPPMQPPPVIKPGDDEMVRRVLEQNPQGAIVINGETGKPVFISPQMLERGQ